MRTLRLSLIGTVILMLLGGLNGAVVAESDEEAGPVTHVSGTLIESSYDNSQEEVVAEGDINRGQGTKLVETYEWSDPRLPAVKTSIANWATYPAGAEGRLLAFTNSNRLDGPDGSWIGTARGLTYPDGTGFGQDVYIGEGAYEGLVAMLECDPTGCDGYIVAGDLPPMPEPVPAK